MSAGHGELFPHLALRRGDASLDFGVCSLCGQSGLLGRSLCEHSCSFVGSSGGGARAPEARRFVDVYERCSDLVGEKGKRIALRCGGWLEKTEVEVPSIEHVDHVMGCPPDVVEAEASKRVAQRADVTAGEPGESLCEASG